MSLRGMLHQKQMQETDTGNAIDNNNKMWKEQENH